MAHRTDVMTATTRQTPFIRRLEPVTVRFRRFAGKFASLGAYERAIQQ